MTYDEMFAAIDGSDKVACSALLALYGRQTEDEQVGQLTAHTNSRGFDGADAPILSSFAEQVKRNRAIRAAGGQTYSTDLSPKQLYLLRGKLRKYWRQLLEIAEEKAAAKAAKASTVDGVTYIMIKVDATSPESTSLYPDGRGWRFLTPDEIAERSSRDFKIPTTIPRTSDYDEFERIIHGQQH